MSNIAKVFTFPVIVVIMLQVNYFFNDSVLLGHIRRITRLCSDSNSRAEKMLEEIKAKREVMINCASKNGFTSEMTIQLSQELDELMNEYQRSFRNTRGSAKEIRRSFKQMVLVVPTNALVTT